MLSQDGGSAGNHSSRDQVGFALGGSWVHARGSGPVVDPGLDTRLGRAWSATLRLHSGGERPVASACPSDMVAVDSFCMDRYEAPNRHGALPLVMFTYDEASSWCRIRGKRLCQAREWTRACAGPGNSDYPYGNVHEPGRCNDDRTWRPFHQATLDGWPPSASAAAAESFEQVLAAAAAEGETSLAAQHHVRALYQADPSGARVGCCSHEGVYDLCGNVEEWTHCGEEAELPGFSGALKGRYWAEPRRCQSAVHSHGDGFRFYEVGFRCCCDRQ